MYIDICISLLEEENTGLYVQLSDEELMLCIHTYMYVYIYVYKYMYIALY
jgi:hypothetical protein